MRVLGILSLVAMALSGVWVGTRLLALGRRTRQQPELLMGLGLLLVAAFGGPCAALGRLPGLLGTTAGDSLFALGLAATQIGIALFSAFTWRVFRSDALWATLLLVVVCAVLGVEWLGLLQASQRGATMEQILPHTRPWGIAIVATVAFAFGWTGCESFVCYRRLRRQLVLELAESVVVNRMGLWALSGFATVGLCGVIALCMLAGLAPLRHALPLSLIGCAASLASACWLLAFAPPARYLRAVQRRGRVSDQRP